MSVEREEVLRIARLAKLRLEEHELERMTGDLNSILAHVDALEALAGSGDGAAGSAAPGGGDDGAAPVGSERPWSAALPSSRPGERTASADVPVDPAGFAPDFRDGFFRVPSPPGVHAGGTTGGGSAS